MASNKYGMRNYLDILNEGMALANDKIDDCLLTVAAYIRDNSHPDNWHRLAQTLREYGYSEPVKQNRFYRVLFHEPTEQDRAEHATIGDLYEELQREIRFDLNRVQGFTTSFDRAVDFIHGQYHIQWYRHEWPRQNSNKPLGEHGRHTVAVIYEVEVADRDILWTMRGLMEFLKALPRTGRGWDELHDILTDEWTGYGGDDEIVIDTSRGSRITGMVLYDSTEHGLAAED
jgi:hypothetical protein